MKRLLKGMDRDGNEGYSEQKERTQPWKSAVAAGAASTGASEEDQGAQSP